MCNSSIVFVRSEAVSSLGRSDAAGTRVGGFADGRDPRSHETETEGILHVSERGGGDEGHVSAG